MDGDTMSTITGDGYGGMEISNDFVTDPDLQAPDLFSDYGSKIQAICKVVQQILNNDPTEKMIIFSQYDGLRHKIKRSMKNYGFEFGTLDGGPIARNATLR